MPRFSRLRSLLAIPAPLLAAKLVQRFAQMAEAPVRRASDRTECTFGPNEEGRLGRVLLGTGWIPEQEPEGLAVAALAAMRHEFDLLGSGPVHVALGMEARGFLGHRYPPAPDPGDPAGAWNAAEIPQGSREESDRVFSMIEGNYTRVDWQIDFKSGYRWGVDIWYRDCRIGPASGADIKVPWELGRMQHLPLLALAFAYADGEQRQTLWAEFRNQVLDFVASNPPRWGVQWRCPMDVAIRISNVLMARDMFLAAGSEWDDPFEAEICRMARDHARHVAKHLEWSAGHTGNHYLADIAGLVFCAGYLPSDEETDGWLSFGLQELSRESDRQFLPDGGSYEASTSYHRLSGEMVAWVAAFVLSLALDGRDLAGAAILRAGTRNPGRAPSLKRKKEEPTQTNSFRLPRTLFETLQRAADFSAILTKPDGTVVQIGDNDSGRFFKIETLGTACLDHRAFVRVARKVAEAGLSGGVRERTALCQAILASLEPADGEQPIPEPTAHSFGDLEGLFVQAGEGAEGRRQRYEFRLSNGLWDDAVTYALSNFGLYVLRSPRAFLSFRCGKSDWDGRGGHAHNDALSIELWADGQQLVRDPGSFVYTADLATRNVYRSASAHFAPQIAEAEPNPLDVGTFLLPDRCKAEVLAFGTGGFAGRHFGFGEPVYRVVILLPDGLQVVDFIPSEGKNLLSRLQVETGEFAGPVPFSRAYGLAEGKP